MRCVTSMKAKKILRSDYRSLFTLKNVLTLLLSFIIALLIVIFTDFAEGEQQHEAETVKSCQISPSAACRSVFIAKTKIFC